MQRSGNGSILSEAIEVPPACERPGSAKLSTSCDRYHVSGGGEEQVVNLVCFCDIVF